MKIPSNRIGDIAQYFRNELSTLYAKEEIEKFIEYCFDEFSRISRSTLVLEPLKPVGESDLLKYHFAVKDLKRGRPIQYILGKAWFYGMEFIVSPDVLVPRPETEELVRAVVDDAGKHSGSFSIIDVGTGSGCIAVTLKKLLPRCHVYALDVSPAALAIARQNAEKHGCEVHFIEADILDEAARAKLPSCSVIVSNPPYVKRSESAGMHKNVLEHEPHLALFVEDEDALVFYRAIAAAGKEKLKPGGTVFVEINEALGLETCILFQKAGYGDVLLKQDLQGKDRIVISK